MHPDNPTTHLPGLGRPLRALTERPGDDHRPDAPLCWETLLPLLRAILASAPPEPEPEDRP